MSLCSVRSWFLIALALILSFDGINCEEENSTKDLIESWFGEDGLVGRTFGHNALKRLSFIFLPVTFTLGVISTLLFALAVVSVKNLAIGVMLLVVSVSQAMSRLLGTTIAAPAPQPLLHYTPLHARDAAWTAPSAPYAHYGPLAREDTDLDTQITHR